jgi:hypothetical protein
MIMYRRAMYGALLIASVALALVAPGYALAHGGHTGPSQTYTQAVGPYELAITIESPSAAPAPLYIDVAPMEDVGGVTMRFRAVPRGQPLAGAAEAQVQGMAGPQGLYYTELQVDRLGDWDLEVRADGPLGSGRALLPFTIVAQPVPAGSIALFVALGGLVALMAASIILAVVSQRSGRKAPAWANWAIGQAMFACLIAAAVLGVQQFSSAVLGAQAASTTSTLVGRPHANMELHLLPEAPVATQPVTLTLDLTDGSTGLPVDDLISHHDALVHLVVISQDGGFYDHIHPARAEPGRYQIALTPDRPGRYTAYAEIQRQDSGTQVLAREFGVGGTAAVAAPRFEGFGARTLDGMQIDVSSSLAPLKAGRQATITFSFSKDGQPVGDLQPWLGMAGHLIARSADGAILAHVHAIGPMAPGGVLNSGVNYGPDVRFVYSFPQPGSYQFWGQFRHDGTIVTVPVAVEVQ